MLEALRRSLPAGRTRSRTPVLQEQRVAPTPAPLAVRVRHAVNSADPASAPALTPQEIAEGTAALHPEGSVPADLLHRLLTGKHDAAAEGLSAVQLAALARLLGLPLAYFLGSDQEIEDIDAALEILDLYRDPAAGVPYMCGGAERLTASQARAYSSMMRRVTHHQAERPTAGGPTASERSAE